MKYKIPVAASISASLLLAATQAAAQFPPSAGNYLGCAPAGPPHPSVNGSDPAADNCADSSQGAMVMGALFLIVLMMYFIERCRQYCRNPDGAGEGINIADGASERGSASTAIEAEDFALLDWGAGTNNTDNIGEAEPEVP